MISAATGAMASLMGPIIVKHGIEYLFATTVLTGIIQWIMGALNNFAGESYPMYIMVVGTLVIVYLFPRITKAIPSALVAIIVMTIIKISADINVRTVGDMGEIIQALPYFHVPLSLILVVHTYGIIQQ